MPELTTPRILVVDDNEQNLALARATLEDEGYRVATATSGEEGLRAFAELEPDCLLLDIRMPGMDGTALCARLRASPRGAEVPILFLTAFRDIETFDRALQAGGDDFLTKPVKPAELVIRVQTALKVRRLSAELGEQYEIVRHQRDALMRLQLQKERLSGFIIHDLKNPVHAMDLHAQVLLRNRELPPSARESLLRIREGARELLRLILNLLDLGKVEEQGLAPALADVDLPAMVTALLDTFAVKAGDAQVTLRQAIDAPCVRADPDLLRRMLENLIDNALQHAPKGSTVSIGAVLCDDEVEIWVRDQGSGVPLEMRDKIFERFVQLEASDRVLTRTGRGLGLTFCQMAAQAQGGRIWIEDAEPGAIFCVRLPAGQARR